jgi:hypothetical protein
VSSGARIAAANEATARDVNEAIERGRWHGEQDQPLAVRCECSRSDCNRLLDITPRVYEEVRAHGRRFVMVPGHEREDIEFVVARGDGYVVVEKRDQAGEVADATDPRA